MSASRRKAHLDFWVIGRTVQSGAQGSWYYPGAKNPGDDCNEQAEISFTGLNDEQTLERESKGSPNEWTSEHEGGKNHAAHRSGGPNPL
jgi:hypothetical protein